MNKVQCAVCGRSFSNINNKHLAGHTLTADQYRERYPGMPLMSDDHAKKLSDRSVVSNASRKGVPRTDDVKQRMREGQARYNATDPDRSRGPMSEEQKQLLADLAHGRYANGFVHPNSGKHQPQAVKQKIATTLNGRKVGPEIAMKAVETKRQRGDDLAFFRGRQHTAEAKSAISIKSTDWHRARRPDLRAVMVERIAAAKLTLLNSICDEVFQLRCEICSHAFTRHHQIFHPCKFHVEICDQCYPISPVSDQENEVAAFVAELTDVRIIRSDMEMLSPLELDIYVPDLNLAIEYNGLYWHSKKHRYYHRHKFDLCRSKGIRLITIFEDEWLKRRPIVESMLRHAVHGATRIVNARSCTVRAVPNEQAIAFLNANHVQGRGRSNVKLGLWLDDELIAVMSFIDADVSHRSTGWEINRFCSQLNCSVRGAASKLFAAFRKEYRPDKVTSYADLRWGEGKVYEHLGFQLIGNTVPNYWYVKGDQRYHRYALRKTTDDPVDVPEWQLREQQGWSRVWDCGHAKWILSSSSEKA